MVFLLYFFEWSSILSVISSISSAKGCYLIGDICMHLYDWRRAIACHKKLARKSIGSFPSLLFWTFSFHMVELLCPLCSHLIFEGFSTLFFPFFSFINVVSVLHSLQCSHFGCVASLAVFASCTPWEACVCASYYRHPSLCDTFNVSLALILHFYWFFLEWWMFKRNRGGGGWRGLKHEQMPICKLLA